jgi:choline dehydrogenase
MGPNGSKMAVVDFQGKVYKVAGLRVVDASIFPDAVSAAPNTTVIMTAEKIADQIKYEIDLVPGLLVYVGMIRSIII